jgi:hypothetical protein
MEKKIGSTYALLMVKTMLDVRVSWAYHTDVLFSFNLDRNYAFIAMMHGKRIPIPLC